MTSETFTFYGKRYRLIPPGTYKSTTAWWVDWHDDAGRRLRCSSWTMDFEEAKRFAYNIASGMGRRDARSQNGYAPAPSRVAREVARSDAEAKLISAWLPPSGQGTGTPAEIIAGAIAGMPSDEAIRLLRRTIRRIKEDAMHQRIREEDARRRESGDVFGARFGGLITKKDSADRRSGATFGAIKSGTSPKIEVSAPIASSAEGQETQVNTTN